MSNLEKLARANAKTDPYADQLCDWMKERACTACCLFSLFAAGFISGCVVRGWFT